jgi:hypothetical protein
VSKGAFASSLCGFARNLVTSYANEMVFNIPARVNPGEWLKTLNNESGRTGQ